MLHYEVSHGLARGCDQYVGPVGVVTGCSGALRTGTAVTPTHNYFGSYHHVIITRKVAHASKNSCALIMSVYVHIITCALITSIAGQLRDLAENTFLMTVSSGLAD